MIDEPMKELMLTMSAWRRLYTRAKELEADEYVLGPIILFYMNEAWTEAAKDLKQNEKKLKKQMKEAKE